ncbi:hypothetical protein ACHWQZ_G003881 [Mnemiopsis leidyi]
MLSFNVTNVDLVARSPHDTRTNQDLPGSNSSTSKPRDSYRRPGFTKNPSRAKSAKGKKKKPKSHKVVLLTDATMQGFKADEFSKRYDVKTINKRSIEALSRNLAKTSDDITKFNPEAVYIHLGTQDILKEDSSPGTLAEDLIQSIDKILRDTSQSCKILVSHVVSCGTSQSKTSDFRSHLSHRIAALKNDQENAVLWSRVSENLNSNFLANGNGSPYKYLFVNDMAMQSIISWNIANINGLLGKKSEDPDFVKIIDGNDIICLQETFEEVQLPGYVSYSNLRTSGKGGGVTTLIRKPLSGYCTPSNHCATVKGSMNLIIIQLAIDENCVFIINTYIPPSNSKGNKNCSAKHFDTLHRAVSNIREHHAGSILLCGDLNARIGCYQEFADHKFTANILPCTSGSDIFSRVTVIPPGVPISTKRACMDTGTNTHKKPFLELLGAHDLLTLNGRTIGDSLGRYTCFKWNGNSVVDYIAVSSDLLHQVKQFVVEPHTLFSDHNPIKLHLWSNGSRLPASVNITNPTDAPLRYKITPDTMTSFKNSLRDPNICDAIMSLKDDIKNTSGVKEDVKNIAERISDLINNVARSNFQLSNPPKATKPKHDVWFKGKCSTARKLLKRSLKVVDNFPDHSNIKARHRQNNRNYRKMVNKARDRFFDKLNDKIVTGKIISWRDFKKLKKFSKSSTSIDQDNLDPFRKFYEKLYKDEHPSIDQLTKSALLNDAIEAADNSTPNETLNEAFSIEELNRSIQQLKA